MDVSAVLNILQPFFEESVRWAAYPDDYAVVEPIDDEPRLTVGDLRHAAGLYLLLRNYKPQGPTKT